MSGLKVPFYWGDVFDLSGKLVYGWSNSNGMIVALRNEVGSTGSSSHG